MDDNYTNILLRLQQLEREITKITANGTGYNSGILFTIKDTEFLLHLVNNTNIPAERIDTAQSTIQKLKGIHSILMEKGVSV